MSNSESQKDHPTKYPIFNWVVNVDLFSPGCLLLSIVFFLLGFRSIQIPLEKEIGSATVFYVVVAIFFLLLPRAAKISLAKLITFEKEVERVQANVKEFKAETRDSLRVYNNLITTLSNTVSQTVNVNLPSFEETKEARESLDRVATSATAKDITDDVAEYIAQSGGDLNFALARLRMDIERELREILGKRTAVADPHSMRTSFLSARQLFRQFVEAYPGYKNMHQSFDYILKVCNAAIHGQKLSDGYGEEALYMGVKMLEELKSIRDESI